MKKNFSVNIGGQIFNIDDDAYERLNTYLAGLRQFFSKDAGHEEIMADIEMRIAELLEQKKGQNSPIITLQHIEEVIAGMGEPEQLSDEGPNAAADAAHIKTSGKLFRDPDHRQIGGVAAGIAAWFGIDPLWIRLFFVAIVLFYGTGAILYFILWIILPVARTTSERLEMQRQIINIGTLRNEVKSAGSGIKNTGNSMLKSLGKILRFLTEVVSHIFRLLLKILKIASGVILLLFVLGMFTGMSLIYLIRDPMHTGIYRIDHTTVAETFTWLIPGASVRWPAYIAIALILVGLAGMLIFLGLRLMLKWPPLRWQILSVFGVLILFGMVMGGSAIYNYSMSFAEKATDSQVQTYAHKSPSIHIAIASDDPNLYWKPLAGMDVSKHSQEVLGEITFSIRPAPGDSLMVTTMRESSEYNAFMATNLLKNMQSTYVYQDTLLTLNPYFSIPKADGMHHQAVEIIVGIPVNKRVFVDQQLAWKVNFRDFVEKENHGGEYIMTSSGLKPLIPVKTESADTLDVQ